MIPANTRPHSLILLAGAITLAATTTAASAQIDGGIFDTTGADTVARYFHAAGALEDGTVMVSGGLGLGFPPSLFSRNQISFYDPGDGTFSAAFDPLDGNAPTTPILATARSSHTQTTLTDGRVLIVGGNVSASGTSPGSPTALVEIFDPQTGTMGNGTAMSAARAMHTATELPDGRVVVAGGSTWQVFQPGADDWSLNSALLNTRTAHAAVLLPDYAGTIGDDRILLIGGAGSGATTLELIDPNAGTTALYSSTLTVGVDDLAATRLGDGRVLIVGGQNVGTGDTVSNAYLFDPVLDVLTIVPDVPNRADGLADHQMVRFGRYVVVFGGEQQVAGTDTVLDYAAIFDSVLEQWTDDGLMLFCHDDFAAVPLSGCEVLLIDGGVPFLGQEVPSQNCELFTLATPGDTDGDGDVDLSDLASVLGEFGASGAGNPADVDHDGDVDLSDLALVLANFGASCD